MAMTIRHQTIPRRIVVKGSFFGARGDSCSCDPCDCNPCTCGDGRTPNLPDWRVSGCAISEGKAGEIALARLVLLSLAQPRTEEEGATWEEVLLVDDRASAEQMASLLALFEDQLEALPAELGPLPRAQRAIYRVPLEYSADAQRPFLRISVTPDRLTPVRASEQFGWSSPRAWSYDGPMALREAIDLRSVSA